MGADPAYNVGDQRAIVRNLRQYGEAHDGALRHILQQLGTGGGETRSAQRAHLQVRNARAEIMHHLGSVFVAGMFAGHDQQIDRSANRRR